MSRENFIRCIKIHLGKNPRERLSIESREGVLRKGICENFSSFIDDETPRLRCLLNEYFDKPGEVYLNEMEAMQLCSNFHLERATKCATDGQLPCREDQDAIKILERYQEAFKRKVQ